jgi:hypothetical protein
LVTALAEEGQEYQSYLLRLWRASLHGKPTWRASLESAQTGERRSFADLASLFAFLEQQTRSNSEHGARPPGTEG